LISASWRSSGCGCGSNLADIDAGSTDLVRLLMLEFSLVYGNDWFPISVGSPVSSLHRVTTFVVTDFIWRSDQRKAFPQ